jgi:diguanylate cyclase (GGDEF)-like protein
MEAAAPVPGSSPPLRPLEAACLADAVRAAAEAIAVETSPADALDAALGVLHSRLDNAFVAAHVLEHDRLWLVGGRGYAVVPDGLPVTQGVVGRAVRTTLTQYVPDLEADPDNVEAARGATSELAVPLSVDGEVVGALTIESVAMLPSESPRLVRPLSAVLAPVLAKIRDVRVLDLAALSRLAIYLSSLRDAREIVEIAAATLGRILPVETSQVCLRAESGLLEITAARRSEEGGPEPLSLDVVETLRRRGRQGTVIEQIDVAGAMLDLSVAPLVRSIVVIPLRANGTELGLLIGSSRRLHELDRRQAEVATLFAAQVAATLDATLALGRERRSALTDPLTGLLNRRGFEIDLERALAAALEQRSPLSLWVLDFDDFKEVNDRAGHEFGDALLREVGHVLTRVLPESSSAGRLGGDEFVVMFPGADADEAGALTQRIREELLGGLDDAGFPLRASIGIASYPFDGGGGSQLLRAADQALYEAKAKGKNCVVAFRELVRDSATAVGVAPSAVAQDRRGGGVDSAMLAQAGAAALALWREKTVQGVADRLCRSLTFAVGATGCNLSRVTGAHLVDVAAHALRDVPLAADSAYLIDDFPVTKAVLESAEPRSISFLDDDLDRAEAFVLRDLEMSCALLLPLVVGGRVWGLVELYDMRLRRYSAEQQSVAEFLVGMAGNRIEALGDDGASPSARILYRVPDPS